MNTPQTWSDSPIHEQIRTMSTDTPETDEAWSWFSGNPELLDYVEELSRRLERERDELKRWTSVNGVIDLQRERDEAREQLAEIEAKMRGELGGHPDSELWGDAGLIAATMRCVDALDEVTEQRDEARAENIGWQNKWQVAVEMAALAQNELTAITEQRDRLAEELQKACAYPTTGNWYAEAEEALQSLTTKP